MLQSRHCDYYLTQPVLFTDSALPSALEERSSTLLTEIAAGLASVQSCRSRTEQEWVKQFAVLESLARKLGDEEHNVRFTAEAYVDMCIFREGKDKNTLPGSVLRYRYEGFMKSFMDAATQAESLQYAEGIDSSTNNTSSTAASASVTLDISQQTIPDEAPSSFRQRIRKLRHWRHNKA